MLLAIFPSGVKVVQMQDPGTTGNFEITLDGNLIHSKKTQGHGFYDTAKKEQQDAVKFAIATAVQALGDDKRMDSVGDFTSGAKEPSKRCSIM